MSRGYLSLLAGAAACALSTAAWGQAPPAPAARTAAPAAPLLDETEVDELIVTADAERILPGSVVGEIKPDEVLTPAQIQAYGVSTLAELLEQLAPQLSSNRGRGGEQLVILLNGKRISGPQEIQDIPTEAILRTEILPEDAALNYGYSADQRVVNIVLRRRFRGTTAELGANAPTAGGRIGGQAEYDRIQIDGDNRVHVDLRVQGAGMITEEERDIVPFRTQVRPFDVVGNVSSVVPGGEIDPRLSTQNGRVVTIAGAPVGIGALRPLTLQDFAATGQNPGDTAAFRSLAAETRNAQVNAVWGRAFDAGLSASVNATLEGTSSESWRGLPGVTLRVPGGSGGSPFAGDVLVDRYVTTFGALKQTSDNWNGRIATTINKTLPARWRLNVTGFFAHAETLSHTETSVDASALQARLTARDPTASAFGPLEPPYVVQRGRDKGASTSDVVNGVALLAGPLPGIKAPAGNIFTALRAGVSQSWFESESLRSGVVTESDFKRTNLNAQANVSVPIARKQVNVLPMLGNLSVNASAAVEDLSDTGTLTTVGYGVNWSPIPQIQINARKNRDENAPSQQQLGAPVVATDGVRVFDYLTGRTVDIRRIDGGNPLLVRDTRHTTSLNMSWRPFQQGPGGPPPPQRRPGQPPPTPRPDLTLTAEYTKNRIVNPLQTFPAVSAEIEAAFPERFVRNAAGDLAQVDFRPLNFARATREEVKLGIAFSRQVGRPQPPQRLDPRNMTPAQRAQMLDDIQRTARANGQTLTPAQLAQIRARLEGQPAPPMSAAQQDQAIEQMQRAARENGQTLTPEQIAQMRARMQGQGAPGGGAPGGGGNVIMRFGGDGAGPPPGAFGGGFGGPGGGGGFGGGGFGGPMIMRIGPGGGGFGGGPPGVGRLQFAVFDTIVLEDELLTRRGGPVFDRLNGASAGNLGGRPRHTIEAQAGYTKNGLGFQLNGNWRSDTFVKGAPGSPVGDLNFGSLARLDLRLFANFGQVPGLVQKQPFLRGARMTLQVQNLFDAKPDVTDASGKTPLSYQPDVLDPVGRTVRVSFRKLFF